jgi:hypothetical protein
VSDIQMELLVVLGSIKKNDLHHAFEAWKKWWDRCIHGVLKKYRTFGRQKYIYWFGGTKP